MPTPIAIPMPRNPQPTTCVLAVLGAILPTFCPPAVAVQLAPQPYPDGQHPPPCAAAQLDQPLAQLPAPAAAAAVVAGLLVVTVAAPLVTVLGADADPTATVLVLAPAALTVPASVDEPMEAPGGATTVTALLTTTVVVEAGGQDVNPVGQAVPVVAARVVVDVVVVIVATGVVSVPLVGRKGAAAVPVEVGGQFMAPHARSVAQQPPPREAAQLLKPGLHVRGFCTIRLVVVVLVEGVAVMVTVPPRPRP
ncbi:hypothetical protein B0A49_05247 [Cryomyces minteri]|uniref:Uncharacterized protein n=1 Tax=Cryomyces minteri TaxID=331657 RepID=A0A4U0WN43_9PEZI|nr:hypothetical protein B0A49_05247 [Cryomyces minteri]